MTNVERKIASRLTKPPPRVAIWAADRPTDTGWPTQAHTPTQPRQWTDGDYTAWNPTQPPRPSSSASTASNTSPGLPKPSASSPTATNAWLVTEPLSKPAPSPPSSLAGPPT